MTRTNTLQDGYEYVVIGTGAAGAACAVELARQGKQVLMIEKGAWHTRYGRVFGKLMFEGLLVGSRSKQGVFVARGRTVGGSTMIYQGNAFDPQEHLLRTMGIDLRPETDEIKAETDCKPYPESFFEHCHGGNRIREIAAGMGYEMEAQQKFINPELCDKSCDACMNGCPRGAKWTTREWVSEACALGAHLLVCSAVDHLVLDRVHSRVLGVALADGTVIRAGHVVLAAGAIGSAGVLQRSGISHLGSQRVGTGFTMDPMTVVLGWVKDERHGTWGEQTFTHAREFADEGFMIANSSGISSWLLGNTINARSLVTNLPRAPYLKHAVSMFVKFADEPAGAISPREKIDKVMSTADSAVEARGLEIIREILVKSGANPRTLSMIPNVGGHPGSTTAMGRAVNRDFSTEYQGLSICDAGVIPVSPGAPPSLVIMGMGKLCARVLAGRINIEDRFFNDGEDDLRVA